MKANVFSRKAKPAGVTVEPAIAGIVFWRAFVAEHYQPEVAARCGPVG